MDAKYYYIDSVSGWMLRIYNRNIEAVNINAITYLRKFNITQTHFSILCLWKASSGEEKLFVISKLKNDVGEFFYQALENKSGDIDPNRLETIPLLLPDVGTINFHVPKENAEMFKSLI